MDAYDVVVLGTGAAGLTAAIAAHDSGARVAVFEKAEKVGGTSAWSGGMVWIPMNAHMAELGIEDRREDVLTYLLSMSHGLMDEDLVAAFVDAGPAVIDHLEAKTPAAFQVIPDFPDYHPEQPGAARGGGRSMECPLFPFADLGEWQDRVTVGPQLSGNILMSETSLGRGAPGGVPEHEMQRRRLRDERGAGQGLVGALLKGCLDRGIEPVTGARAVRLLMEDDRVVGVVLETGDGRREVWARGGVVLATGGFEWDRDLVRAFVRGPLERTAAVPTNTGDGLKMAMRIGAGLGNMREAWWVPMIDVGRPDGTTVGWQVNGERSRPHSILVNRKGQRFTDEAANYNALGAAFHVLDVTDFDYVNHPAWLVVDDFYLSRYGLAGHRSGAGRATPDWIVEAPSLTGLAERIGVPADALAATVERWNEGAREGRDPDFRRGESLHDRWWGDSSFGDGPESTVGPLDTAPYYAVQVFSGCLGTKGGPRTDTAGQVLDVDGHPFGGLYAAGNVMASALGMTYGGAGGTLGPAMVFGFLSGRHAAERAQGAGT
jgi:succinate dehydrogenase/fumarate reductase flavoprotein subunit